MKKYTDYRKLKSQGDEGEKKFMEFLRENGFTNIELIDDVYETEGINLSDWDVRATDDMGLTHTFEVKTQEELHEYGWFNVEQVQTGKPGGIATSKADIWVFVNSELGFGFVDANDLKKIHYNICKDPTVKKKNYLDKERRGDVILWATKFRNMAAGFRLENNRLNWIK